MAPSPKVRREIAQDGAKRAAGAPISSSWATERAVLGKTRPADLDDVRAVAAGRLQCYLRAAKKDCNSEDDSSARMNGVTAISWLKRASAQMLYNEPVDPAFGSPAP